MIKKENRYDGLFQYYAEENNLDWALLKTQAQHERGFYLEASPGTNPEEFIKRQAESMRIIFNKVDGEIIMALAAYSCGMDNVLSMGEKFALEKCPAKTKKYVSEILSVYKHVS